MSPRIVIVGGGLAGLAAAVALTDLGMPCTLLESRPRLGGRASSFHDPTTGTDIDNCQHVTLGCCTNFRHFCQTVGIAEFFRREQALHFAGPTGKIDRFAAGPLPAPLHLTGAFAGLSYLSWSDKLALANGLKELARPVSEEDESKPFSEWLHKHRQPTAAIERFWFVVLVSALSESLDRISVKHARKVFVDAFIANRDGWYVDIPTVPLEDLYGGRLTEWLTSRGTVIRLLASAEKVEITNHCANGVKLVSSEIVEGDEFVLAVPFHRVSSLLPAELLAHPDLQGIQRFEAAPISSIHLWFDRPLTELPHAVLVDRVCQWVFNRTAIGTDKSASGVVIEEDSSASREQLSDSEPVVLRERKDPSPNLSPRGRSEGHDKTPLERGYYYQVVISASHDLEGRSKQEILQAVLKELFEVWPDAAEAKLLHSRQVTEHRAVFSPVPGIDEWRPLQQSPVANLQLAGDWTRTGWPATMEGAVRSGYLAAANILKRMGKQETVIQPDLPTATLSRWLFGL